MVRTAGRHAGMPSTPTRRATASSTASSRRWSVCTNTPPSPKDPLGLKLFEAGDAEARAEVPHFDTGGWSLYDQFGESNLNYHELLTEFLQHLCERTRKGPPYTPGRAAAPSTPPATPTNPAPGPPGEPDRRHDRTAATGAAAASPADRGRSGLLHHRTALHRRPEDTARDLAAVHHAARRDTRRGADLAVEDRHGRTEDRAGLARCVEQPRDGRTRQAKAPVGDARRAAEPSR